MSGTSAQVTTTVTVQPPVSSAQAKMTVTVQPPVQSKQALATITIGVFTSTQATVQVSVIQQAEFVPESGVMKPVQAWF